MVYAYFQQGDLATAVFAPNKCCRPEYKTADDQQATLHDLRNSRLVAGGNCIPVDQLLHAHIQR